MYIFSLGFRHVMYLICLNFLNIKDLSLSLSLPSLSLPSLSLPPLYLSPSPLFLSLSLYAHISSCTNYIHTYLHTRGKIIHMATT